MADNNRQSSEIPGIVLSWVVVIAMLWLLFHLAPVFFALVGIVSGVFAVIYYRGKGERGFGLTIRFVCWALIVVGLITGGLPFLWFGHPDANELMRNTSPCLRRGALGCSWNSHLTSLHGISGILPPQGDPS